jgi:hypothetical protein
MGANFLGLQTTKKYQENWNALFCPCWSALLLAPATTLQKKPPLGLKCFESDHEIMQNGIICLKKFRHSSNHRQNPGM